MKPWFLKREYPEQIIKEVGKGCEIKKVVFCENKKKIEENKEKGLPFVVTYHLRLKGLSKIIKGNLYLYIWMLNLKRPLHQVL